MHLPEFFIASLALILLPGPDILFVMTQSITRNARAGIFVALGLCSGLFVHTSAAALGISLVIAETPWLFELIRYAGILYLLFMGWNAAMEFFRPPASAPSSGLEAESDMRGLRLYKTGVIMNLVNPKVIFFFLAFLPQFIQQETQNPAPVLLFLGTCFAGLALLVFTLVSLISGWLAGKLSVHRVSSGKLALVRALVYFSIAVLFFLK